MYNHQMTLKRIGAAIAAVGIGAFALIGCGEPAGQISPNNQTWVVTFTKDYQIGVGRPLVRAVAVCKGSNVWTRAPLYGFNSYSPATYGSAVYCPNGFTATSYEDFAS